MSDRRVRRRIYQEKKKRSGKTGTAVTLAIEGNPATEPDHSVLRLQRTIGNKATTQFLQRREEPGSATMVSSVAANELALDDESFTSILTNEQAGDQTPTQTSTEDEIMGALEERAGETNFVLDTITKHPSMAQMGIRPKNIKGFKVGVYIGNSNYNSPFFSNLDGAKRDAEQMKSTMEGYNYSSLPIQKDKTASELDSILSLGVQNAKTFGADALLLYYAGHGMPEGLVGVNAQEEGVVFDSENQDEGDAERGFNLSPGLTDVEAYSKVMQHLSASVANGVHTTLIVDACHSGAGTELFRAKVSEQLSEKGSIRTRAVSEQIARLEDLKQHVSPVAALGVNGGTTSQQRSGEVGSREADEASRVTRSEVSVLDRLPLRKYYRQYWDKVVRPELRQVSTYLKEAGLGLEVPEALSIYTVESLQQQINLFINKLLELAEIIQQEEEESTLEKAGA